MKRTFEIDVLKCPECGGQLKLIALIGKDQLEVVKKILKSMGLAEDPPARAPARPPPQMEFPHDGAA